MAETAVIFDVDGVLLELTDPEASAFFHPFKEIYGLTGLSDDWDSYRVRNDCNIMAEILENHLGRPPHESEIGALVERYIAHLEEGLTSKRLKPQSIPGASQLLAELLGTGHAIGIATSNLLAAARMRLEHQGLWEKVKAHPFGAEPGGPKRDILARAIANTGLPRERIVYVGDNLNDVDAGLGNGVHFIGFSLSEEKRRRLGRAGARHTSGDHRTTAELIRSFIA
jgi:phosphoglycolate phosphatase